MSIEVEKFLKVLGRIDTPTPKTVEFDILKKLGQGYNGKGSINDRWWDKIGIDCRYFSKQKYHIYGTFRCAAYHDGIINPKCKTAKECEECYENGFDRFTNKDLSKSNLKDNFLQTKYNRMGRPEMYLWFVEAFGFLNGKDLKQCFEKAAEICHPDKNKYATVRDMIEKKYGITWDAIAERANEIADEMGI
jgi:hypothetical protein